MALSVGTWGTAGLFFIGGVLKCEKSIATTYITTFLILYTVVSIFSIRYVAFGDMDYYDRQIDKMPPKKRKLLWWIYSFLTYTPIVLCVILGFYIGATEAR